jgi:hypothetical protein
MHSPNPPQQLSPQSQPLRYMNHESDVFEQLNKNMSEMLARNSQKYSATNRQLNNRGQSYNKSRVNPDVSIPAQDTSSLVGSALNTVSNYKTHKPSLDHTVSNASTTSAKSGATTIAASFANHSASIDSSVTIPNQPHHHHHMLNSSFASSGAQHSSTNNTSGNNVSAQQQLHQYPTNDCTGGFIQQPQQLQPQHAQTQMSGYYSQVPISTYMHSQVQPVQQQQSQSQQQVQYQAYYAAYPAGNFSTSAVIPITGGIPATMNGGLVPAGSIPPAIYIDPSLIGSTRMPMSASAAITPHHYPSSHHHTPHSFSYAHTQPEQHQKQKQPEQQAQPMVVSFANGTPAYIAASPLGPVSIAYTQKPNELRSPQTRPLQQNEVSTTTSSSVENLTEMMSRQALNGHNLPSSISSSSSMCGADPKTNSAAQPGEMNQQQQQPNQYQRVVIQPHQTMPTIVNYQQQQFQQPISPNNQMIQCFQALSGAMRPAQPLPMQMINSPQSQQAYACYTAPVAPSSTSSGQPAQIQFIPVPAQHASQFFQPQIQQSPIQQAHQQIAPATVNQNAQYFANANQLAQHQQFMQMCQLQQQQQQLQGQSQHVNMTSPNVCYVQQPPIYPQQIYGHPQTAFPVQFTQQQPNLEQSSQYQQSQQHQKLQSNAVSNYQQVDPNQNYHQTNQHLNNMSAGQSRNADNYQNERQKWEQSNYYYNKPNKYRGADGSGHVRTIENFRSYNMQKVSNPNQKYGSADGAGVRSAFNNEEDFDTASITASPTNENSTDGDSKNQQHDETTSV